MTKTFNPCDECSYNFSKNNQESKMCKICEFKKYMDLEDNGLLLRLPCKVGDIVYRLTKVGKRYDIRERVIGNMTYRLDYKGDIVWEIFSTVSDVLGKTVFLTREEAEKKLKEMEKVEKR